MDILMPVLDGVEATRRIRQRKDGPQPFIVALTASALPEDRERFASAGFDSYLAKPVELADLAAVLSEAYGNPGKNDLKAEDDFVECTASPWRAGRACPAGFRSPGRPYSAPAAAGRAAPERENSRPVALQQLATARGGQS